MVRATKILEKGIYVCNLDGVVLEPEACKAFLEKAEAHSDHPDLVLHDIQIRWKKLWEALWEMDDQRK